MEHKRPMFSPQTLVRHLADEGVRFSLMNEAQATQYLTRSTNFFKINTYKKNFIARQTPESDLKQYAHLEFAYLRELDSIDRSLRRVLSAMCLDVEHAVKVRLLHFAHKDPHEDGYRCVRAFCESLGQGRHSLHNEIERNADNPYCAAVIGKYEKDDLPLWAFVEVIPFGRLLRLYQFYAQDKGMEREVRLAELLELVRDVRNAVAHNNCMLCDLTPKHPDDPFYLRPPEVLLSALRALGLTREQAHARLSNPRVGQITALLYIYPRLVADAETRAEGYRELREVAFGRMREHPEYFAENALLRECYQLLLLEMDAWHADSSST